VNLRPHLSRTLGSRRWLALTYAVAAPERVPNLVLLSARGLLPIARQFSLPEMLMVFFPTRFTVNSFMRWAGFLMGEHEVLYDVIKARPRSGPCSVLPR
jgi:pimeloyl-ACP methyl ester carboxylesterase